mmetsp:Transcript_31461/g.92655  ORF Transcript_31461/g.92655 Transcript_31461/m.92655 type:complete len:288 (+) Transcript_31461:146-1009(+)
MNRFDLVRASCAVSDAGCRGGESSAAEAPGELGGGGDAGGGRGVERHRDARGGAERDLDVEREGGDVGGDGDGNVAARRGDATVGVRERRVADARRADRDLGVAGRRGRHAEQLAVEPRGDGAEHDVVARVHGGPLRVRVPQLPERGGGLVAVVAALEHEAVRRVRVLYQHVECDVRAAGGGERVEHALDSDDAGGRVQLVGVHDVGERVVEDGGVRRPRHDAKVEGHRLLRLQPGAIVAVGRVVEGGVKVGRRRREEVGALFSARGAVCRGTRGQKRAEGQRRAEG